MKSDVLQMAQGSDFYASVLRRPLIPAVTLRAASSHRSFHLTPALGFDYSAIVRNLNAYSTVNTPANTILVNVWGSRENEKNIRLQSRVLLFGV